MKPLDTAPEGGEQRAREIVVSGQVQGVGFRPFVYRLAQRLGIAGTVRNTQGRVVIVAEGERETLCAFERALIDAAPPLARPTISSTLDRNPCFHAGFCIVESARSGAADIHLVPDVAPCPDCLAEMNDPAARRYRYPFTNCTQCGPRYTIIEGLPYDRAATSMAAFALCGACRAEYEDPGDRRFHAEPLACPDCGPTLIFAAAGGERGHGAEALRACCEALERGAVVAVKGVGGYRLMCDAADDAAVRRLRERKHRPAKPLAVMFPETGSDGLAAVRSAVDLSGPEAGLLTSASRPIVLAQRRSPFPLSPHLAPGLDTLGVMLPTSPLDHLLMALMDRPLVATSGNLSGEPMLTDDEEAERRLGGIAGAFLSHDRRIVRPADDPVIRVIAGKPRAIRLGRGTAPAEIVLPQAPRSTLLAAGGHHKVTVALGHEGRAVVSPHIGELDAPRSLDVFRDAAGGFPALHGLRPDRIVADAHPGYASTRWARRQGVPVDQVWHHHAHASGVAGEHPEIGRWLVFTWDGVGLGPDGTLWGGETLYGAPGRWRRVASLRPFRLPGGDKAAREPWRSAAAVCWETGTRWSPAEPALPLVRKAWEKRLNAPETSAAGRLFDAAAALVLGVDRVSFEGEGPMRLEAAARPGGAPVVLPLDEASDGLLRADWAPLIPMLLDETLSVSDRASIFHASLAALIAGIGFRLRDTLGFEAVGLTGGVFQNKRLADDAVERLETAGFAVFLPERVPANDGGIAFGQLVEAAARNSDG